MKLNLKSENQNLAATLITPQEKSDKTSPALIFIHGWKSNQEGNIKRAKEISKLGFLCLTLDLRGHGKSEGKLEEYSRKDHLEDIKAAYKYLSGLKEVNKEKIGIIGSSYGGYLAALSANDLKFHWLILRVPALYYDKNFNVPSAQLIKQDKKAFIQSGLMTKDSIALKAVSKFKGKILILESENDTVIPNSIIENYIEVINNKSSLTYEVMKKTNHSLETPVQEKKYIGILKKFLIN